MKKINVNRSGNSLVDLQMAASHVKGRQVEEMIDPGKETHT